MRIAAVLFATSLAGVLVTLIACLHTPPQPLTIRGDKGGVDEKIVSYHCYKHTLNAMLELLAHGNISLEDARDRVYQAALRYYPCYLNEIILSEKGSTPQERVARNLVGHLRVQAEMDPTLNLRVFALEIEFAVLQRKDAASFGAKLK